MNKTVVVTFLGTSWRIDSTDGDRLGFLSGGTGYFHGAVREGAAHALDQTTLHHTLAPGDRFLVEVKPYDPDEKASVAVG